MKNRLLKYRSGCTDLFYSSESRDETSMLRDESYIGDFVDFILNDFLTSNQEHKQLIDLHSKIHNLNGEAILSAHGYSRNNKWVYSDGVNYLPVQDWIRNMDGRYATLILHSCNPGGHEIESKKSSILAPNQIYSEVRVYLAECNIELYLPGIGYVNSYLTEWYIKRLKKLSNKSDKKD